MKAFVTAASVALLGGCLCREPNYRNYGERPHEWSLPGPEDERKVFGPMPFAEVREFVRSMENSGWEVIGYEPASVTEKIMIDTIELDRPIDRKSEPAARGKDLAAMRAHEAAVLGAEAQPKKDWTFDISKTYDDGAYAPAPKAVARVGETKPSGGLVESVPPYLDDGVKPYRQKYLVIMRRWK